MSCSGWVMDVQSIWCLREIWAYFTGCSHAISDFYDSIHTHQRLMIYKVVVVLCESVISSQFFLLNGRGSMSWFVWRIHFSLKCAWSYENSTGMAVNSSVGAFKILTFTLVFHAAHKCHFLFSISVCSLFRFNFLVVNVWIFSLFSFAEIVWRSVWLSYVKGTWCLQIQTHTSCTSQSTSQWFPAKG